MGQTIHREAVSLDFQYFRCRHFRDKAGGHTSLAVGGHKGGSSPPAVIDGNTASDTGFVWEATPHAGGVQECQQRATLPRLQNLISRSGHGLPRPLLTIPDLHIPGQD